MNVVEAYSRLAGVYDEIVVDPCYSQWADFLHERWSSDPAGVSTVLDVCCGTGLMDAVLIARGYHVVGVDASPAMLARARRLLGPDVALVETTLPELTVEGVFDAAISTFDGLNYLTPTDFTTTLSVVADRLRPGGWLVFDLHTDAMLALAASRPVIDGEDGGHRFTITNRVNLRARTCVSRIEVSRGDDGFAEDHLQYFHGDDEVRAALQLAGFRDVARTDEYTDEPVGPATLRATWIARRTTAE
ncbi:MAG: class I SAM-dependent methyltransferase [Actinobacteria bacterium]|nr:class I SAM-dependent methyltransferase [Actinomycetota bacterium]